MYLLYFLQNGIRTDIAIFNTIESGRKFLSKIPSYKCKIEKFDKSVFEIETINPKKLNSYLEIEHNGNIIPITKFMFQTKDLVEIEWKELTNVDQVQNGMLNYATLVDAYVINNEDLKNYISKRENKAKMAIKILINKGFIVERAYAGSEDGEAIIYKKENRDWLFLSHLDPYFVEYSPNNNKEFEKYILNLIEKKHSKI